MKAGIEVWLAQKLRLKSPLKLRVNNEKLIEEVLLPPEFTSVGIERSYLTGGRKIRHLQGYHIYLFENY